MASRLLTCDQGEARPRGKTVGTLRSSALRRAGVSGALFAVAALCGESFATDFFVRPDGSDSNAGTANSAAGAWKTLAKCAQSAQAGDRCLIQPGTYYESSVSQSNAGSLESNNLLSDCTCTSGATTISCGSAIPATVNSGDFVQCDNGYGFSWTRVASVSGSTITLESPYRGANSSSDTLDVARFVEIVGQGAGVGDVVLSNWYTAPASVTWTKVSGRSCVWSYDPAAVTGSDGAALAWRARYCSNDWYRTCSTSADCQSGGSCILAPRAMRDLNTNWDRHVMGIANGLDPYFRVGDTTTDLDYNGSPGGLGDACPCGDASRNKYDNLESVPGSFSYDNSGTSQKVYVSPRRRCDGGSRIGYTCYGNADCPGSTCGACPNPATLQMQVADWSAISGSIGKPFVTLRQNYTVARNFTLDAGDYLQGGLIPESTALVFGASNALYEDITVQTGVGRYDITSPGGAASDLLFHNVRLLAGARCTAAANNVTSSGLAWVYNEIRGTMNQLWSCDALSGVSSADRIKIQRGYYHRNLRGLHNPSCGHGQDSWNCSTKYWSTEYQQWDPGHGVYHGSAAATYVLDHILVENTILEATSDGFQIGSRSGSDLIFRNNTIGTQGSVPNESLDILFGTMTAGSSGTATLRNNMFILTGTQGGTGFIGNYSGVDQASIRSDYNLFVNPYVDTNEGSAQPASGRVWKTNSSGVTLSNVISSRGQETHSIFTCKQGCQGASPGTHVDAANDARVNDFLLTDYTPTDYTPKSNNWGVNAGDDTNCPVEDYFGRRRTDGRCDIGAIEYQSGGGDVTPPSPVTNFTANPGDLRAVLSWTHSASSDNRGTMVRVNTTGFPSGPTSGTLVCDKQGSPGAADSCNHTGLVNGTMYYYAAFSYDAVPNYGQGANASSAGNASPSTVERLRRTDSR